MNRFRLLLAALLLATGSDAFGQGFDLIQDANGTLTRGVIKETSRDKVVIEVNEVPREFQVNQIVNLTFRDDPLELKLARRDIKSGNFESALEKLKRIDRETLNRDIVKQDIDYYTAFATAQVALFGNGDKGAAALRLRKFVEENPGSYHYFESLEIIGNLAVGLGNYEAAEEYYGKVAGAPWPDYRMRGWVLQADAMLARGKYREAYEKYNAVLAEDTGAGQAAADRQKMLATVGKASCLAEGTKPEDGIRLAEGILEKADPKDTELYARAYNAMGRCYRKAGKPKDALLAYLHTDILFYAQPDAHAEALFHLSSLWGQVNKKDRALKARSLLKARYPDSIWAKQF